MGINSQYALENVFRLVFPVFVIWLIL